MQNFEDIFGNELNHAYVVEGERDIVFDKLVAYLKNRENTKKEKADFLCKTYDAFSISDSEAIKEWHSLKNSNELKKICVLAFHFINHDAERTLLKTLEEPHGNTHFFIVVPSASQLLDTILSRVHVVSVKGDFPSSVKKAIDHEMFLKSSISMRMEQIASLIKEYKDIEGSGGLRHEASVFVESLQAHFYKKWDKKVNKDLEFTFSVLDKAKNYLSLPGASVKMILEEIALVI